MKYKITFDCGHSRNTRSIFTKSETPECWVGTRAFCDTCGTVKEIVKFEKIPIDK